MATHHRYGRFARLAMAGGPLLVAGIAWAGPARADDTSYLKDLHNAGIQDVDGDAALVQTGQKLCTQISYGVPPRQLKTMALQRSDAKLGANGLTAAQANAVVHYAIVDLCPEY